MAPLAEHTISTRRLRVAYREAGEPSAPALVLLHGNASSSVFFEPQMAALADGWHVLAPDLRGFGGTAALPIDATRGLRDWSDDLAAFLEAKGVSAPVHLMGWSMGGGVAMQYVIDHPQRVRTLILESPLSPYGFGGTTTADGRPAHPDWAGSGGGTVSPVFVERLQQGQREAIDAQSPRTVMNQLYFRPPFRLDPVLEDRCVDAILSTRTGPGFYPGSSVTSPHWPGVAPGPDGVANAMSPAFANLEALSERAPQALRILWMRGADDQIVSDTSLMDFGTLGQLGAVPGWPGPSVFPPQPMVSQTRQVLEAFAARGGTYQELVVAECGHAPHLERPEVVVPALRAWLSTDVAP